MADTKISALPDGSPAQDTDLVPIARAGANYSLPLAALASGVAWGAVTGTLSDQTDVQTALNAKAPLASPAFTGTPTGITKTHVGLANVDNTADSAKPVSTAQQTALDLKKTDSMATGKLLGRSTAGTGVIEDITLGTNLSFTGTTLNAAGGGGVSDGDKGDITVSASGATWTIDPNAVSNSKLATMTTKTYKGRTAGTTGDPEDVAVATLKTDLALNNVDNTTDAGKPVSTAQQTALNLKANLASPTFTGTPALPTGATAVTQSAGDSTTALATTAFTTTADNLKANLASPTFTGTVTVPGLTINDATDLTISATTGTKIGQAGSKIGFYGIAPAVRPTALTQTYATASSTHAAVTQLAAPAGGTGIAAGGWSSAANRDLAIVSINAARTDIANLKDFVNAVVDRLQLLGLLQ